MVRTENDNINSPLGNKPPLRRKGKLRVGRIVWVLVALLVVMLYVVAQKRQNTASLKGILLTISGSSGNSFIGRKEVFDLMRSNGIKEGMPLSEVPLNSLENILKSDCWIASVKTFFDNSAYLHIAVWERRPVARVFTINGGSFYLDSQSVRMPVSRYMIAKVPVFTGFPSDRTPLSEPDSALLRSVTYFGEQILKDSFWRADVSQVYITPQADFQLYTTIGDEVIEFGDTSNMQNKFDRLYTFYKQAWKKMGIDRYSALDVRYDGQLVAILKRPRKNADSLSKGTFDSGLKGTVDSLSNVGQKEMAGKKIAAEKAPVKSLIVKTSKHAKNAKNEVLKKNKLKKNKNSVRSETVKNRNIKLKAKGKKRPGKSS